MGITRPGSLLSPITDVMSPVRRLGPTLLTR